MKNLIALLVFALLIGNKIEAQQKSKTHFMMLSIHAGRLADQPEIIVTKEDDTQEITKADKKSLMCNDRTFNPRNGKIAANEDSLFLTLKPFLDAGWKLVSTNIKQDAKDDDYIARYFFTKEED